MPVDPRPMRRLTLLTASLVVLGLALAGCGRKGDPFVPGAMPAKANTATQTAKPDEDKPVEDSPFLLDPLL